MEEYLHPILEAVQVSFFVMVVMMLMEFIQLARTRVSSSSLKKEGRSKNHWTNLIFAACLGLIPGCIGGFTSMSMYTHGMFGFSAVLASSFTAMGDDVFRMIALMPGQTVKVALILLGVGLFISFLVNRIPFFRNLDTHSSSHIQYHPCHEHEMGNTSGQTASWKQSFHSWSFSKVLLLFMLGMYVYGLLSGFMTHTHEGEHCVHAHFEWTFENTLFLGMSVLAMVLVLISSEHFIQEHLWNHILKKHFLSIFLYTLGTLYFLLVLNHYVDLQAVLSKDASKMWWMLLAAIAIGWIPQSGPHFIFIQLFFTGIIPFPVFLANCIVQDGHTSLVLLAESGKQFVYLKSIKTVVAFLIGGAGLLLI